MLVRLAPIPFPMKLKSSLLVLAFAGLTALVSVARAAANVGDVAPDFTLTDLAGKTHHLADYKGKIVVLEWNNPDCPFVHKHYDSGNIPALQRKATADGVIWLTINSGAADQEGGSYSVAQLQAYLQKANAAPTAYLRDGDGRVGHLYGAKTTPHLFVISADGKLAYAGAIDSVRSADAGDIPAAKNYVVAALADLKAGRPVATPVTRPYGCGVKY